VSVVVNPYRGGVFINPHIIIVGMKESAIMFEVLGTKFLNSSFYCWPVIKSIALFSWISLKTCLNTNRYESTLHRVANVSVR
jgi:hypothetical protein